MATDENKKKALELLSSRSQQKKADEETKSRAISYLQNRSESGTASASDGKTPVIRQVRSSEDAKRATKQVNQKPRAAVSQLVNKYQNMAQDMNTEYQVSQANRKTETAQKGVMDAAKRNSLYQSALSAAQTEKAQAATRQREEEQANAKKNAQLKKEAQARRMGVKIPEEEKVYPSGTVRTKDQSRVGAAFQSIGISTLGSAVYAVDNVKQIAANQEAYEQTDIQERLADAYSNLNIVADEYGRSSDEYAAALEEYERIKADINTFKSDPARVVSGDTLGSRMLQTAQEKQAESMEGLTGVWRDLAEAGYSVADNLTLAALSGFNPAVTTALMSAKAGVGRSYELAQQGVSAGQALARGIAAGGIEYLTEKMGIDNLFDMVKYGQGNVLLSILKQGGIEGAEEIASYLLNFGANLLANDPNAEFDFKEMLRSGQLGAISGLMFGVGGTAINALGSYGTDIQSNTEQAAVEEAIELIRQGLDENGAYQAPAVVSENATGAEAAQVESPVSATENAQERTFAPEDKTVSRETNGQRAAETQESAVRDAETVAQDLRTVSRAATTLGENGSSALRAVYSDESVNGAYSAEDVIQGFTALYNQAQGKKLSATAQARANTMPDIVKSMAESAGLEDARRAKQAAYFGEKSGIVRDDNLKKANLSYKTTRTLDALGKALGVQVRFTDSITDDAGNRAFGNYKDGVISVALDSESPVQSVVMHEAVHRLREVNSSSYEALSRFVLEHMSESHYEWNTRYTGELYGDGNVDAVSEEVVADAFGTILNDSGLLEQFAREHTTVLQRIADSIRDTIRKVNKAVSMEDLQLTDSEKRRFSDLASELAGMEKTMRNALRTVESQSANKNTATEGGGNDAKYSIKSNGNYLYVQADRQALSGDDSSKWGKQIEDFINKKIRNGEDVLFPTADGHILALTERSAYKLSDRHRSQIQKEARELLSDKEYSLKGKIAGHIDEIIQVGVFDKYREDINHAHENDIGEDGFNYFTAYFMDADGSYYRVRFSSGLNGNDETAYSIGDIQKRRLPSRDGSSGETGALSGTRKPSFSNNDTANDSKSQAEKSPMQIAIEQAQAKSKGKFKLAAPVEESGDLVALHNASEYSLLNALELGGLPMPSIAVVKSADGHSKYGPISLVFDKSTIDPQTDSRNKVYGGDAWTPTAPQVDYQVDRKAMSAFEKEIARLSGDEAVAGGIFRKDSVLRSHGLEDTSTQNLDDLARSLTFDTGVRAAYLSEQGETLEPVMQKKTWNKEYGNGVLQAMIDKLGAQKISEIVADMETGESAAFSDSAETIRDVLEEQVRQDVLFKLREQAIRQQWPSELLRKKVSQRLEAKLKNVTNTTLENLVQDAWAMYQDGGNTKSETIDLGDTAVALREAVDSDKVAQWVKQKLSGVLGEAGIYNGKDPYTASGNRRKFSSLHYSYTLENLVKAMQATQEERGGGIFGLNAETLQSVAVPEYKSVQDIRNDRGRLFMEEEGKRKNRLREIDFKINEVFSSVQYGNKAHSSNPYIERDNISNAILEAAKGKRTVDAIVKSFRKNGYTISNQTALDLKSIYKAAGEIPTGYFEAKPQRAVGFDEVLTAVIPSDSSTQLREGLEQAGVPVVEYEAGNESDRLAKVNSVENAKFSRSNKAALEEFIQKYGEIEPGENPSREVALPRKTAEDKHVSQTVRTIMEAKATPDTVVETLEDMVANGDFSFDSITDKESLAAATKKLEYSGWMKTLNEWSKDMNSGKVTKDNTVMGWALYDHAANSGDTATAIDILNMMVKSQRSAAQALQATRVLKQLSPDTQLYQVQRSIQSLQEEINNRYGEKGVELTIDQELAEDFLKADSQAARDAILTDIYRDIGKQLPSTFKDKWNAWRYLAMLGNPRTHVRNIAGNAGFMPVVAAKNLTATAIESAVSRVSGGKLNRTKSLVLNSKRGRSLLSAAWGDYAKIQEAALSGSKGSDSVNASRSIEEGRQIFKFKPLEAARKGNSYALDAEDVWFSKPHYAYALASYCNANNIRADTIRQGGKPMEKARAYAIKEAQKATYRDTNAFSQMVGNIGGNWKSSDNLAKKVVGTAVEGVLPFRKTPANILARGVEYSPIGLLNGIKQATMDVRKGKATGAQAIDSISAGLTGTGLMGLGVLLASLGKVRGNGGEDDKEKDFKDLTGHQDYAWQLDDGTSITLDWLAPEALPFFIGVNLWEQTQGNDEEVTLSSILNAVTQVSDPLLEMSMLQSLNDLIDSVGYASSKDTSGLAAMAASVATSYLTQALPTIFGQIERTGEDIRYTTFTDKNNKWLTKDMQYTIGKASAKIPGVDFQQIPYIDAWGREESTGSTAGRALNNFLNPSYVSQISESDMEKELLRLYEETGEGGVFPSRAVRYFNVDGERKDLTADEYVKYAKEKGQTSQKLVTELVKSKAYSSMTDADKAKAVKEAYDYANQTAKQKIDSRFEPESWITKAQEAQKKYGISQSQYITLKIQCSDIVSLKDKNGDTIENSKSLLIMEAVYDTPGLNEEQRKAMFEYLGVGKKVQNYNKTLVKEKLAKMRKQAK